MVQFIYSFLIRKIFKKNMITAYYSTSHYSKATTHSLSALRPIVLLVYHFVWYLNSLFQGKVHYYFKLFFLKKSPGFGSIITQVASQLTKKVLTHNFNSILRFFIFFLQQKITVIILVPKLRKHINHLISLLSLFSELIFKRMPPLFSNSNIIYNI